LAAEFFSADGQKDIKKAFLKCQICVFQKSNTFITKKIVCWKQIGDLERKFENLIYYYMNFYSLKLTSVFYDFSSFVYSLHSLNN
jgi:hypothetical protein